jgi:hypothetical protein
MAESRKIRMSLDKRTQVCRAVVCLDHRARAVSVWAVFSVESRGLARGRAEAFGRLIKIEDQLVSKPFALTAKGRLTDV